MNTSLPKYQVCYLVRSIHTLDQKYMKTKLHNTKEDAINEYEQGVQKYITLGIMRLYQVELATIDLLTGKTISKELIISNSSDFWDEYYNRK